MFDARISGIVWVTIKSNYDELQLVDSHLGNHETIILTVVTQTLPETQAQNASAQSSPKFLEWKILVPCRDNKNITVPGPLSLGSSRRSGGKAR